MADSTGNLQASGLRTLATSAPDAPVDCGTPAAQTGQGAGEPGCRCKDPKSPRRHGPYYQLSFTVAGRSSTMFLKREELAAVRQYLGAYRAFRRLNTELVAAYVAQARRGGVASLAEGN